MKNKSILTNYAKVILLLPLLLLLSLSCKKKADIRISDEWISESIPESRVSAAYMKIENLTEKDDALLSVDCEDFEMAEFHNTFEEGGMTKMEAMDYVTVKSGESVKFEPGGMHIMLINNKRVLKAGDKETLNLRFQNLGLKKVVITVKSIQEQVK